MLERVQLATGLAVLVLLTLVSAPNAQALAVVDFASYAGHAYYLLDPATWLDSEAAAIGLGGHLATIDDAAENDFVTTRFGVSRSLWIGLTDQLVEGTFVWASGAPLVYTNWSLGEPSNCTFGECLPENYVEIFQDFGSNTLGKWNDLPNDLALLNGVVEVNTPVPEPSSVGLLSLGAVSLLLSGRRRRGRPGPRAIVISAVRAARATHS